MHAVGNSMNGIYRRLRGKISVQGREVAGTEELPDSGFTPLDAADGIATARTGYSPPYMSGEPAWYFTGRDDVESTSKFPSSIIVLPTPSSWR